MIGSTKGKIAAALVASDKPPRGFPPDLVKATRRKLAMLVAARRLEQLLVPPGNRLEPLSGNRSGLHSIRINDQWRVCFRWDSSSETAYEVEIVDYH